MCQNYNSLLRHSNSGTIYRIEIWSLDTLKTILLNATHNRTWVPVLYNPLLWESSNCFQEHNSSKWRSVKVLIFKINQVKKCVLTSDQVSFFVEHSLLIDCWKAQFQLGDCSNHHLRICFCLERSILQSFKICEMYSKINCCLIQIYLFYST